ncbi:helix-turn-helix domain-containing protein [Burkholderia ubonensis]|uniref:helix-turn-helix domain-containing protein n=2 Tax=Burkholderia ubonensis TaxID=101571 RepID=UPI000B281E2B
MKLRFVKRTWSFVASSRFYEFRREAQCEIYDIRRMGKKEPVTVFGRRLRQARRRAGIPQDKLGVEIGLDETSASARISRYESGVHQPPVEIAQKLAKVLKVPTAYLYCDNDELAELLLSWPYLIKADKKEIGYIVENRLFSKGLREKKS